MCRIAAILRRGVGSKEKARCNNRAFFLALRLSFYDENLGPKNTLKRVKNRHISGSL
jgi:hypothetical protein